MNRFSKNSFSLKLLLLFVVLGLNTSCLKDRYEAYVNSLDNAEEVQLQDEELTELQFPTDFLFETEKEIVITINDDGENISYELYPYTEELREQLDSISSELPHQLFERTPKNGSIQEKISVPSLVDSLLFIRKSNEAITAIIKEANDSVDIDYDASSGKSFRSIAKKATVQNSSDCTNIFGLELYPDFNGVQTSSNNGIKSISNIYFPENDVTASIQTNSVDNVELSYPFLLSFGWFSTPMYTLQGFSFWIDSKIETRNSEDGYAEFEMTFSEPISQILMHFRGVDASMYEFVGADHTEELISGGYELIYDENSRTLRDSNPKSKNYYYRDGYGSLLITATNGLFDKIIWRRVDDPNTNSKKDSNWFTFTEITVCDDLDNDGAVNSIDVYPNDPTKAFESFYPTKTTVATLMFEDLWPFRGDYDFNDTAIEYAIKTISNSNNEVVEMHFDYEVVSDGASFKNAFAFEIEGILPEEVTAIEGQLIGGNVFNLSNNGTEQQQTNLVIPIFEDHSSIVNLKNTVVVKFAQPISKLRLGNGPYKPFLVVNGKRETEIHLKGNSPTSLGNNLPVVSGNNVDEDGNYATTKGLPWAINVVERFPLLNEKDAIDSGYLYFKEWAISGGTLFKEWYKDKPGYRDNSKLVE